MPSDVRVCFIGDSYVAGVGDPHHLGWVGRVAARSHAAGFPLTAYGLGVRGQTSEDVAARWQVETAARLPPGCDGRVVLAFGVNDTTVRDGVTRVPGSESLGHLGRLLHRSRDAGWPVLVVGPPPVAESAQNERIARLDAAFSAVSSAAEVGYVRVFDELVNDSEWMRQVAEGDGAHPSAGGYQRLADLIWPSWHRWITVSNRGQ